MSQPAETIDHDSAWDLLRAIKRRARRGDDLAGARFPTDPSAPARIRFDSRGRLETLVPATPEAERLFALCLPLALACAERPLVVGHLGQSLDGRIATERGASHYINGPDNILHLHRLRALCDAVVVGWRTVASDDPQLTVRRVPGDNPLRAIIDLAGRLGPDRRLFNDGAAPTLVLTTRAGPALHDSGTDGVERCRLDVPPGEPAAVAVLAALRARGCACVLVEGGGRTVSAFLEQGQLDRLQVAVAPLIIGSGVAAFTLPPVPGLEQAIRPVCRTYAMGADVLFDLDLRA